MKNSIVHELRKYYHNNQEDSKELMDQNIQEYAKVLEEITTIFPREEIENDIVEKINFEYLKWNNLNIECEDMIYRVINEK